uniref:Retrotrans_gag domain-containing protein n=1 Tax=Steinernema glaseri TaxID=37863 RepID=A0A1I8AFP7_9BILA
MTKGPVRRLSQITKNASEEQKLARELRFANREFTRRQSTNQPQQQSSSTSPAVEPLVSPPITPKTPVDPLKKSFTEYRIRSRDSSRSLSPPLPDQEPSSQGNFKSYLSSLFTKNTAKVEGDHREADSNRQEEDKCTELPSTRKIADNTLEEKPSPLAFTPKARQTFLSIFQSPKKAQTQKKSASTSSLALLQQSSVSLSPQNIHSSSSKPVPPAVAPLQPVLSNTTLKVKTMSTSGNTSKALLNLPVRFEDFSGLPGTVTFPEYFETFEAKANSRGFSKQETGTALLGFLTGPALTFVNSLPDTTKNSYQGLIKALSQRFNYSETQALRELSRCKQKPLQPIETFADKVSRLVLTAYPADAGYSAPQQEKIKVQTFISGLHKDTRRVLERLLIRPSTLQEALVAALEEERLQEDEKHTEEISREEINAIIDKKLTEQVNNMAISNQSSSFRNQRSFNRFTNPLKRFQQRGRDNSRPRNWSQ